VLQAIGCSAAEVGCALTLTLGRWTTPAEVDAILERLPPVVAHVRAQSGAGHSRPRAE
jgi:cysteine sulfinate desulfinase/cysteine desulfurase-like protein